MTQVTQDFYFDKKAAASAVRFFERYLVHIKGKWAGEAFRLEKWQQDDIIVPLFGCRRADGSRQYRTCYIEIPRKNGKSSLCSGIALYLLFADNEASAEVYSAAADNLTFDGSSIRGFSAQRESDLRLGIDWSSIFWLPSDVFGPGKVIFFATVLNRDHTHYESDFRARLAELSARLGSQKAITANLAAEIEGFLVNGINAEQHYDKSVGFSLISSGGYFHSLPLDKLKKFIDTAAEAQRAMGFRNEKDHPEVAPSQFELNFSYAPAVRACDMIQLYKLLCRQVAANMGMTATFLPKPIAGVNGSGMHMNISFFKDGKNMFYDADGAEGLSSAAWDAISRILNHGQELSLILNASVNAYRRLDPHFEAPNQIKVSSVDRSAMVRIPAGNENSARFEVRSVGPDANPYLAMYAILRTMLEGKPLEKDKNKRDRVRCLPGNIYDAVRIFRSSEFMKKLMGPRPHEKYIAFKQAAADRSPKELGTIVKSSEVLFHHEVTDQMLWHKF